MRSIKRLYENLETEGGSYVDNMKDGENMIDPFGDHVRELVALHKDENPEYAKKLETEWEEFKKTLSQDPHALKKEDAPTKRPPGPRLKALMAQGLVTKNARGEYIGRAADGQEVQLGSEASDPAGIENYLSKYPSPSHW